MEEKEINYLKTATDDDKADISEEEMEAQLSLVEADPDDYEDEEYDEEYEDDDEREPVFDGDWERYSEALHGFHDIIRPQIENNFESWTEIKKSIVWDALVDLESTLIHMQETTGNYELR